MSTQLFAQGDKNLCSTPPENIEKFKNQIKSRNQFPCLQKQEDEYNIQVIDISAKEETYFTEQQLELTLNAVNQNFDLGSKALHFAIKSFTHKIDSDLSYFTKEENGNEYKLFDTYVTDKRVLAIFFIDGANDYCGKMVLPTDRPPFLVLNKAFECRDEGESEPYPFSKVLTHELGHLFGLDHTHNGEKTPRGEFVDRNKPKPDHCSLKGDGLCDTPADPNLFQRTIWLDDLCLYNQPELKDPDGNLYTPDVYNHMSYARQPCRKRFSDSQKSIMAKIDDLLACKSASPNNEMVRLEYNAFPNPFTDQITLAFTLPRNANGFQGTIADMNGKVLRSFLFDSLSNEHLGIYGFEYVWDGKDAHGVDAINGIYFVTTWITLKGEKPNKVKASTFKIVKQK